MTTSPRFGQHPAPGLAVAHLSDPHLLADTLQYGVIDTAAHLRSAIARLRRIEPAPRALIFTGDLADRGEPAAYALLREIVEPAAAAIGAEVVWTMGNHDDRAAYAEGLFGTGDGDGPQDRVHDVDGLRIIALDTTVPGYHHGALTAAQLAWLAAELATPAPRGTILAMHHPPIPVPMCEVAAVIELDDQQALADVVRGSDVRLIVGGHFHYTSWSTFAGIPLSVASATCYTTDIAPDLVSRVISGVDGHQAFTMLHVYDDQVVHSIVPVAQAPEVSQIEGSLRAVVESLTPEQRRDLISRKDSPYYTGGDAAL